MPKPKTTTKAKARPKPPSKKQLHVATTKKAMLGALEKSLGVVTTACKSVGIERTTHYRYMTDDPEYAQAVADMENVALDFAESQLHRQIQRGEVSSTISYLKTKCKHRGYIEKQ